jgi:hypothetical protein
MMLLLLLGPWVDAWVSGRWVFSYTITTSSHSMAIAHMLLLLLVVLVLCRAPCWVFSYTMGLYLCQLVFCR